MSINELVASVKTVGIVGYGAAGMIVADTLIKAGLDVTIFEKEAVCGGVWNYPNNPVMYKSLRTNLPKEIMSFNPDNLITKPAGISFLTHREVQNYLDDFVAKENLNRFVRFSSNVVDIRKMSVNKDLNMKQWNLRYETFSQNINDKKELKEQYFDAVVVCNGHYSKGYIPVVDGFKEYFNGLSFHSNVYDRVKNEMNDKNVLIVGGKSSGTDMARELSEISKKVFVSERSYNGEIQDFGKIRMVPGVKKCKTNGLLEFNNGEEISIDVVLWCTGYEYDFPFLNSELSVKVEDLKRVRKLYLHLFSQNDPTLSFIGLPFAIVPFPLFYFQSLLLASVLTNHVTLPSLKEQEKWLEIFENDMKKRGFFEEKYHYMGYDDIQWDYNKELVKVSKLDPEKEMKLLGYIDLIRDIYNDNRKEKPVYTGAPDNYRDRNYQVNWDKMEWSVDNSNVKSLKPRL